VAEKQTPVKVGKISIRDRVIDFRRVKASDLRKHPQNWRLHPESQRSALMAMFDEVGFVGAVLTRQESDGTLQILDGHLRVDLLPEEEVPVIVTDLSEDEGKKILATYDPLSQMTMTDDKALAGILAEVGLDDHAELRKMFADVQSAMHQEEQTDSDAQREVPGMELQPHEHYDYLVVLATTSNEWNVLCDKLGLKPVRTRKGKATCRALRAKDLLRLLRGD